MGGTSHCGSNARATFNLEHASVGRHARGEWSAPYQQWQRQRQEAEEEEEEEDVSGSHDS